MVPLGGSLSGDMQDARGGGNNDAEDPMFGPDKMIAPTEVKEQYAKWYWCLSVLFLTVCIGEAVARDLVGTIHNAIMAMFVWYLVRENCEKMSQCCVFFACVMCVSYTLIDTITVGEACAHGRVTSYDKQTEQADGVKIITVQEDKHPFYDPSQDTFYNYQSAMMVVPILPTLLGAILTYMTYHKFPSPLFSEQENPGEGRPLGSSGSSSSGGGGGQYGGSKQSKLVFGGSGQRLGSS